MGPRPDPRASVRAPTLPVPSCPLVATALAQCAALRLTRHMEVTGHLPRLGPVDDLDLRPAFQPIVDLRDGSVVGYEALMRSGASDGVLHMAGPMLAAARREDTVAALDHAARDVAIATAERAGLAAPFCLFVNTDAASLESDVPLPDSSLTLLMDVTEQALIERPEAVLRTLTELRTRGWGVALDDVGADSRSLALTSVLYPDVIKLDLRLLDDRSAEDSARIVMAVGAEAERRHAVILAEGIDSPEQLDAARVCGATLGQGYHLGPPAPLPDPLPEPGRPLRLAGGGGDPFGATPWQRITNWRRPARGERQVAAQALEPLLVHAAELGETAMVLGCLADPVHAAAAARRFGWLHRARGARRRPQRGRRVRRHRRARRGAGRGRSAVRRGHRRRARSRLRRLLRRPGGRRRLGVGDLLRPRDRRGVRAAADRAHGAALLTPHGAVRRSSSPAVSRASTASVDPARISSSCSAVMPTSCNRR